MKINFHPRETSKTIIDKDLEAVDYFCISTVAYAACLLYTSDAADE